VDREFFDDRTDDVSDMRLQRGSRVKHERFGEGQVVRIVSVGEPAVVAFFPGWGLGREEDSRAVPDDGLMVG
jgi:hypothetical protein